MQRVVTAAFFVLVVPGCDDTFHVDCETSCKQVVECQGEDGDMAACLEKCRALDDILNDGARKALEDCIDVDCEAYFACTGNALESCTGNDGPFKDRVCEKAVECGESTFETCRQQILEGTDGLAILRCLNTATLDRIADCVEDSPCETLTDSFEECLTDVLGVLMDEDLEST